MKTRSRIIALSGLLLASSLILSALESAVFSFLPAGIRIGLANVPVMLAVMVVNIPCGLAVMMLKCFFVMLTRGFTAGVMSFSGSICAFAVYVLLIRRTKVSYVMLSTASAVMHGAGQICMLAVMTGRTSAFGYMPVMVISSLISGVFTGIVLRYTLPLTEKAVASAGENNNSSKGGR